MKYQKLRPDIVTGDLFFTATNGLFGKVTRLVTQSKVSHVGIFVWIEGRLFVAEATFQGFQLTLASKHTDYYVGKSALTKSTEEQTKEGIFSLLGTRYDFLGMLMSPFYNTRSKQQFCSESVAKILGIDFPALNRGIFPSDIANTCSYLIGVK